MLVNVIIILIIAVLVLSAILYMINQKKKGVACIGCPHAGTCAKKSQGGCNNGL